MLVDYSATLFPRIAAGWALEVFSTYIAIVIPSFVGLGQLRFIEFPNGGSVCESFKDAWIPPGIARYFDQAE